MSKARLLYLLSPAKTLDLSHTNITQGSIPKLLEEAHELVKVCQKLTPAKIKSMMGVSDAIAKLNYERYVM